MRKLGMIVAVLAGLVMFGSVQAAAAQTFTVTNTLDSGAGSLRQAITDLDAAGAGNTIAFAIPGTGPFTITPASALPGITVDDTTVDGCTQPGSDCSGLPLKLMIQVSGQGIQLVSNGDTVRGLSITHVAGSSGPIVFARFARNGIFELANQATIEDDYLGVAPDGSAAGNGVGLYLQGGVRVTSATALQGLKLLDNVISCNSGTAINGTGYVFGVGAAAPDVRISGNIIGLDPTGTQACPNQGDGIVFDVTGDLQITDNTIADNTGVGIRHRGRNQSVPESPPSMDPGTLIEGNTITNNSGGGIVIGPKVQGADPYSGPVNIFGNSITDNGSFGISVTSAADALRPNMRIGGLGAGQGNTISGNHGPGVAVGASTSDTSVAVTIRGNSIFGNTGAPIDLANDGATANGPAGTTRTGPNELVNYPVIGSIAHGSLIVSGTYAGAPNATYTLDFYKSATANGAQTWVGSGSVTTDAGGNASYRFEFDPDVPAGWYVAATATDANSDTSEFTAPTVVPALPGPPTNVTATPGDGKATISWSPPADTGGQPITSYTVTTAPGAGTCTWTSGPLQCTITGLSNGTTYTFTVTATTSAGSGPGASTSAELPGADLSLHATASPATAVAGSDETFTVTVHNAGPTAASDVRVIDDLPSGLPFGSASAGCAHADTVVTCSLASLAKGASHTFTITVHVPSSQTERLVDGASVTSSTPDPDAGNNDVTATAPVGAQADIAISQLASVSQLPAGGQVMYAITASNSGPSDATGVTVTDTPAPGLALVSAYTTQGSCSFTGGRLSCSLGALAAGGSAQVLVVATVSAGSNGTLANTASVIADQPDPVRANNTSARSVAVLATARQPPSDVQIAKRVDRRRAYPGQRLVYTLTVTNRGPGPAGNVTVADTPSLGLRIVSTEPSQGSCRVGRPLRCALGTLRAGAHATITITGSVDRAGVEHNAATVISAGNDAHAASNLGGARTTIKPVLRLAKTASPKTITAGATVAYHLTVTNPTSVAIKHVRVCDALPLGLARQRTLPRAKLSKGRECWTIKSLGARHARTLAVTARALRGTRGRLTNHATATGRGATAATATTTIRVKPAPKPPATPVTG